MASMFVLTNMAKLLWLWLVSMCLVPSVTAENDVSVIDILDMYSDGLPSTLHFNDEVVHWKRGWTASEVSA